MSLPLVFRISEFTTMLWSFDEDVVRYPAFSIDYTFGLNLVALGLAVYLYIQNRCHPMDHHTHIVHESAHDE
ncbi:MULTISPECIES: hypothetical protein [unclassified Sphingomonas]|uniref:hypothetical protein n=1 Tax=unclassified Sphingomonas TaxID=196159 RepID=UPI00226AF711|nr:MULTISPECIES: hypothetical protein [unclassified Sphingomonas]